MQEPEAPGVKQWNHNMTHDQLLSPALRSHLSTFIAEAVAQADLPPLTHEDDPLFLRDIMEIVIDAFWQAFVGQLGEAAQKQLLEANEDEKGEKMWQWLQENADFEKNEGARLLAQEIMEDFATKLPALIAEGHKEVRLNVQKA